MSVSWRCAALFKFSNAALAFSSVFFKFCRTWQRMAQVRSACQVGVQAKPDEFFPLAGQ